MRNFWQVSALKVFSCLQLRYHRLFYSHLKGESLLRQLGVISGGFDSFGECVHTLEFISSLISLQISVLLLKV
ncbi:hypothetical protein D3C85_1241260 [compost metagenome]